MLTSTYYKNIQVNHFPNRVLLGEIDEAMVDTVPLNYKDGYYDIVAHGSPTAMLPIVNGVKQSYSAITVYAILCKQADYHDQPIRLVSCWVGLIANGFAQQLADLAGVPVLAATAKIHVCDKELVFYDPRKFGEPVRQSDLGPKQWIIYHPQTNA